eukprot:30697_1
MVGVDDNMGEDEVESSEWEDVDEDDLVEAEVDLDSYAPVDDDDSNIGHGVAYEDGDEQMEDGNKEDESESSNIPNFTLNAHNGAVYSVAVILGTTGGLVLTGGGDDKALLWKLPGPEPGFVHQPIYLEQHGDSVAACEFSADGTLAASGGYDGAVNVSTVPSGGKVQELKGPSEVEWIAWHPQGNVVAAAGGDGMVWMWLAVTGECMKVFAGHQGRVTCGGFVSSGQGLVSGGEDGTVRVWAPKTGLCRLTFDKKFRDFHVGPVVCLAVHPDPSQSHILLTGGVDGTARLLNTQGKGRVLQTFTHFEPSKMGGSTMKGSTEREDDENNSTSVPTVVDVSFGKGTQPWCATACTSGVLKVWDLATGVCRYTCIHPAGVTKIVWHSSEEQGWEGVIFTGCSDGVVRLWDPRVGKCLRELRGHSDMILDLDVKAIAPGKCVLVTASDDKAAKVWWLDVY